MTQSIIAGAIAAGVLAIVWLARAIARRKLAKAHLTATDVDDFFLDVAQRTKILLLLLPAIYLGARALVMPRDLARLLRAAAAISLVAQTALWCAGVVDFWLQRYRRQRMTTDPASAMTISFFRVAAVAAVWVVAVVVAIDNLGFNVTTLIAGLGIGGVAIALALQNILGDLFASLSIVIDKPFVIGDPIAVDDHSGTVEHIGLKTTRVRSADGEQIVFANGDLLKSRIRNFRGLTQRRAVMKIAVDLDTDPEKLERIPTMLKAAVGRQPHARFDRAHFMTIGDAYEFELVYLAEAIDYNTFLDLRQSVNLDVVRAFAQDGIKVAERRRNAVC